MVARIAAATDTRVTAGPINAAISDPANGKAIRRLRARRVRKQLPLRRHRLPKRHPASAVPMAAAEGIATGAAAVASARVMERQLSQAMTPRQPRQSVATPGRIGRKIPGPIVARTVLPSAARATIATAATVAAGRMAMAGAMIAVRSATIASTP
jgi:hypothetical protein